MLLNHIMKKSILQSSHPGSFGGIEQLLQGMQDDRQSNSTTLQTFYLSRMLTLCKNLPENILLKTVFCPTTSKPIPSRPVQALAEYNDCYNYLLTVIDVFSKRAYVQVLKRKTAAKLVNSFESVVKESQTTEI